MVPKHELLESIPLHAQKLNYETNIYEWEDHVGEEGWSLNWSPKLGFTKKIPFASFCNHLLKDVGVEFLFPYVMSPHRKRVERDTIGLIRGASANLPHCTSFALTYPMENKMPFVHYIIEWWGCSCTIEADTCLNERTQGHLMMKPMSKFM